MAPIVFMDTETTGLDLYIDEVWEFAGIRREEDGTETELHMFITHDERKSLRLPDSFRADHDARYKQEEAVHPWEAAMRIHQFTKGAHIVGAVPNFDTERLAQLMRNVGIGIEPKWHYHLIDIENLIVGYFLGRNPATIFSLPWTSDDLSAALGVVTPTSERHTAMGDVRWIREMYDVVIGKTSA